jgi:hypothetical protein
MEPTEIAEELRAIEGRGPCSDAERRAARALARRLRATGRRPRTQTVWVRPGSAGLLAAVSALGVAASVVSVDHPVVGLWMAVAALVAIPLTPLLTPRRATQTVWGAREPADGAVRLLLTCRADAQPVPLAERALARARLPGPRVLLGLALAALVAFAAVRTGGTGGKALGAAQLLPTAVCIAAVGAFLDAWVTRARDAAAGPAAALAVLAALDRSPPARLAPEVVVAGPQAMRAFLRAQRRAGTDATDVVVVELREGAPGFLLSDGGLLPQRFHPRLVALLRGAAPARRGRSASPASAARGARWPAIALEGGVDDLTQLTLGLVAALDRDLVETRPGAADATVRRGWTRLRRVRASR